MRIGSSRLAGIAAGLLLAISWASTARSASLPFTATLQIEIGAGGLVFAPVTGTGVAIVNGSGGGVHVSSLGLPSGFVSTTGLVTPITDPAAAPIEGLHLTAANGSGAFAETAMGALAGVMPLVGVAKACLFAPCSGAIANLSVPLSVAGAGGVLYASAAVQLTVTGAPWTTGTASMMNFYFTETRMGSRSGTAEASGVIQLVTPISIQSSINPVPIPAFAYLTLHFVPEPVTLTMLGAGIAALAAVGRRRRA